MKKFWVTIFIALLGGSFAGERARSLFSDAFVFFWRDAREQISPHRASFLYESPDILVIGKRLDGFASVLLAAAGENAGIQKGDRAITRDNEYVGRIERVSPRASQIVLASRPGERVNGWLPVLSVPLELQGWGSGLLRALVPASFPIEIEDEIWYDARFDAFVGNVVSIQNTKDNETEARKEIFVRHAVNPLMLSSVFIHP